MSANKHPRIPGHQHGTPGDLIEVYEDELATLVTAHLKSELNHGEKATFFRAGIAKNLQAPKGTARIFHFRVYRP